MRKAICPLFLAFLLSIQVIAQKPDQKTIVGRYIVRYRDIAVREMNISGIPASITLAQGILESNAGQSLLAKGANNHFGIKCHKEWTGEKYYQDDDRPDECFRKYKDPEESFRDHSSFLVTRDRYRALFKLNLTDFKGWAQGLKKAGYATNPAYADLLIRTIEKYRLYLFDSGDFGAAYVDSLSMSAGDYSQNPWISRFIFVRVTADNHRVYKNNGLLLTVSLQGDNLESLAGFFHVSERKLKKYNDMESGKIKQGQLIYLESKKRKGAVEGHVTKAGENLLEISQGYGIKLKMIRKRNNIPAGAEPPAGRLLRLR